MLREADSSPAGWLPQTVLQLTKGRQFPWRPAHSVVHWTWVWSPLRCSPQQTTSEEPGLSLFTDILGRYLRRPHAKRSRRGSRVVGKLLQPEPSCTTIAEEPR